MASLIANAAAGFEPIQGYVLRDKLGAGGYGEVWLADAPGGLKKAIKFIFGSLDESRANSELKALQRIRQVTHPFLLSLERIEIVDGQLIIVTELADGSLTDRFKKFRDDGYVGIPREQLLDYLRDAADALDFLCQKHDLQHLDVKPANMLLVADRVKVADFGLVKDIQSQSMSMLGGMTPTYAAPEMFDGRPGRFSDQYSLAIVYQELLTGTLPFNGRTTAQLASEHLHRAPNLDPVPPGDRPVLAKALAKKASQRFASCREFIDRLIAVNKPQVSAAVASPVEPARARNTPPKADAKPSDPKTSQVQIETGTQVFQEREVINLSELPPTPNSVDTTSPICFIGLGCTGAEVLTGLRQELHRNHIDYSTHPEWTWLLLDTDARCIEAATNEATQGAMSVDATLHLALKPSQYYRECDEASFAPLSRRWLYNVPRSRMTEGVRPLGMLALLDHAESVHRAIQNYIAHLQAIGEEKGWDGQNPIRIYLVASAHGGTGSAWIAEIGFLVRRELEERGLNGMIQAVLTIAEAKDQVTTDIRSACAVTCLNEIAHYVKSGGLHPGLPSTPPSQAVSKAPLDDLYLVHGGMLGDRSGWETAIDQAIEYLFLDGCTSVGRSLDVARHQTHATADTQTDCDWTSWLRTLCSQRIDIGSRLSPRYLASMTTLQAAQRWLVRFRNNQIDMHSDVR
ncbi:MAG: protein kinase [Pirellulales bacterium]